MRTRDVLRKARDLMNDDGAHWIKNTYSDGKGRYCMLGAIYTVVPYDSDPVVFAARQRQLANIKKKLADRIRIHFLRTQTLPRHVYSMHELEGDTHAIASANDDWNTTWEDVRRWMTEAANS